MNSSEVAIAQVDAQIADVTHYSNNREMKRTKKYVLFLCVATEQLWITTIDSPLEVSIHIGQYSLWIALATIFKM